MPEPDPGKHNPVNGNLPLKPSYTMYPEEPKKLRTTYQNPDLIGEETLEKSRPVAISPETNRGINLSTVGLKRFVIITILTVFALGGAVLFLDLKQPPAPQISQESSQAGISINPSVTSLDLNRDTTISQGKKFTATGQVKLQNQANSAQAFSVQDATGISLINVDTSSRTISLGQPGDTITLQIAGNVNINGNLLLNNGDSIGPAGLVLNSLVVCTSAGCKPNTTTTDAVTLQGQGASYFTNASNIKSGTLSDNRLSTNVALLNANQTFTGVNTFSQGTNAACSPAQVLSQVTVQGGLVTGGACSSGNDTLQQVYDASTPPTIKLSTGQGGVILQDASTPLGADLFDVTDSSGANKYVSVNSSRVSVGGNLSINDTGSYAINFSGNGEAGNDTGFGHADGTIYVITNGSRVATFTSGLGLGADPGGYMLHTYGRAYFDGASNSTTAFQIQNAGGTSNLFIADTTNNRIAIDQATASYPLDVNGDINTTGAYRINGSPISSSNLSDSSNLAKLNVNQTFTGYNTFKPTTDSTTAFQVQNAAGNSLLTADTSTLQINISGGSLKTGYDIWGGASSDQGEGIVQAADGGFAIAGSTQSFGAGGMDAVITKYDYSGNLAWSKTWGGAGTDYGHTIVQTSDGGYAIVGETTSFGTGSWQCYIAKYDGMGNLSWSKVWSTSNTNNDECLSLKQTSDGGYIAAGSENFGNASTGSTIITKLDSAGNVIWNKTWRYGDYSIAQGVVQTSDGGYALTGRYYSSANYYDLFILKLDSLGNVAWNKSWTSGGSYTDMGNGIIQTSDGGYAVTGDTYGLSGGSNPDMILFKFDSSGNLTWSKPWGSSTNDSGNSLAQTSDGGYAVTGYTQSYGDGNNDVFLTKYDASGNLSWTKTWGGTNSDTGSSIALTSDGGYAVTGNTSSFGAGGQDMFLLKFDSSGNIGSCSSPTCQSPSVGTGSITGTIGTPSATLASPAVTVTAPSASVSSPSATSSTTVTTYPALNVNGGASIAGSFAVTNSSGVAQFTVGTNGATLLQNSSNSTTAFQVQNASGQSLLQVDTTNSNVTLAGLDSGALGAWNTTTSIPVTLDNHGSTVVNGYMYVVGGCTTAINCTSSSNNVYYAKIKADGTLGAWATDVNILPASTSVNAAVALNGYIYAFTGSSVYEAKTRADGSTSQWQTLPGTLAITALSANGYLYAFGNSNPTTVYYTKPNADGTISSWMSSSNNIGSTLSAFSATSANGYLYILGGSNTGGFSQSSVWRAAINSDGSPGTWTSSGSGLPQSLQNPTAIASNGFLYAIGGSTTNSINNGVATVYYAKLNSDGSFGTFSTNANPLTQARDLNSLAMSNGYIYVIGGAATSGWAQSTVYYASSSRVQIGANLDLIGPQSGDGSAGGSISANNINAAGNLNIYGQSNFSQSVGITGNLSAAGSAAFQNATNSTAAFQVQNAAGASLLTADTTNTAIYISGIGAPTNVAVAAGANTGGSLSGASSQTYYYKVSAVNANGETSASNEVAINGQSFAKLSPPSAPAAAVGAAGNVTGTYTYLVTFVTTNGETTQGAVSSSVTSSAQQVSLTSIPTGPAGTTGRNVYRCDGSGNNCLRMSSGTTITNNTSTTLTDNTASYSGNPAPPAGNTATTSTNQASLTWDAVPGATSYKIYRGTSSGGENIYYTSATNSYTDTGSTGISGNPSSSDASAALGIGTTSPNANLDVQGTALFKSKNNSSTTFQVQDASGSSLLSVDTANKQVDVGAGQSHTFITIWGGSGNDSINSIVQTKDGGYAVTGSTDSFGAGGYDMFIAKYDSAGTLSWNKTWGGSGSDSGNSIVQTKDGGYAVTGYTNSFGAGSYDMFIAKYDSAGNLSWSKTWGGSSSEDGISIVQTSDGGYAVTGEASSFSAGGDYDMFIAKYDSAGNLSWSKTWGGANFDAGYSLVETSDGGYAVTGDTASFGAGGDDIFIARYDSAGNLSWSKTIGSATTDYGNSIIQTSDGGFAITGATHLGGMGNTNMFLAKFTSSGALSWNESWGNSGGDFGYSLVQTSDGGYAVTGYSSSFIINYNYHLFLAKFNSSGVLSWSKTWGGSGNDLGLSLTQTSDGGYAVGGETASYGAGGYDAFIAKYDPSGNIKNCSSNCISDGTDYTSITESPVATVEVDGTDYTSTDKSGGTDYTSVSQSVTATVLTGGTDYTPTINSQASSNYYSGLSVSSDINLTGQLNVQGNGVFTQSSGNTDILDANGASGTLFSVGHAGAALFRNQTNSQYAFQIQNAAGANLLTADTLNSNISVGQGSLLITGLGAPAGVYASPGSNQIGTFLGTPSTNYYYTVSAINNQGETAVSSETSINGANFSPLSAPGAPTAGAPAVGGSVDIGTHSYEVTFVTANGETTGGTASAQVNVTTSGTQTVPLSAIPIGPTGTIARKIYRTKAGDTGSYLLVGTINDNTTTSYNDVTADASLGAAAPAINTATTNTNSVVISWNAVAGATGYKIYRGTSSGGENVYFTSVTNSYVDTGSAGTAGSPVNDATAKLGIGTTSPTANLDVAGTALFENKVDSGSAFQVQNASGNNLLNADTSNMRLGVDTIYNAMATPTGLSVGVPTAGGNLTASTTYYYKVTAIDSAGGETTASNEASGATDSSGDKTLPVTWTAVPGSYSYKVYRSTSSGAEVYLTTVLTNSFTDSGSITAGTATPPAAATAYTSTNNSNSSLQLSVGGLGTPTGQVYVSGTIPKDVSSGGVRITNFDNGAYRQMDVQGKYAYVGTYGAKKLQVFDISNPAAPVDVSGGGVTTADAVVSVAVQGHYAYLAEYLHLQVFDIKNPASPVDLTGGIPIGFDNNYSSQNILVQGRYAYVFGHFQEVATFDISNPAKPVEVGDYNSLASSVPYAAAIQDNYLYVGGSTNKVQILSTANPASLSDVSAGGFATTNAIYALAAQGNYVYVGDGTKLRIFDVSNPASALDLTNGGVTVAPGSITSIVIQGRYAYINADKLYVYDISNPRAPVDVSAGGVSTHAPGLTQVIQGRYDYLMEQGYLQVFDLGGAYVQQIEAGGAQLGAISVTGDSSFAGSASIAGGLQIGQSLQAAGNLSTGGALAVQGLATIAGGITGGLTLNSPLASPSINYIVAQGASGSTSYGYAVSAISASGGETTPGTTYTYNSGNATLSSSNYLQIVWGPVNGASYYKVYRIASGGTPSSTGLIGTTTSTTFFDTGLAASGSVTALNTTANLTARGNQTLFKPTTDNNAAFQVQDASGTVQLNVNTTTGQVTVGNDTVGGSVAKLNVLGGLYDTVNGFKFNLKVDDTTAAGQGVGGGIGFGGQADSDRTFAVIQGYHESATAADYSGALGFYTRPSGSSSLDKVMNLSSTGSVLFENSSDSSTAFQIQNSSSVSLFTVDTGTSTITLGPASSTPVLLVLGTKNTAGDPTCSSGAIYYNSSTSEFRGCANGTWGQLGPSAVVTQSFTDSGSTDFWPGGYGAGYGGMWIAQVWDNADDAYIGYCQFLISTNTANGNREITIPADGVVTPSSNNFGLSCTVSNDNTTTATLHIATSGASGHTESVYYQRMLTSDF